MSAASRGAALSSLAASIPRVTENVLGKVGNIRTRRLEDEDRAKRDELFDLDIKSKKQALELGGLQVEEAQGKALRRKEAVQLSTEIQAKLAEEKIKRTNKQSIDTEIAKMTPQQLDVEFGARTPQEAQQLAYSDIELPSGKTDDEIIQEFRPRIEASQFVDPTIQGIQTGITQRTKRGQQVADIQGAQKFKTGERESAQEFKEGESALDRDLRRELARITQQTAKLTSEKRQGQQTRLGAKDFNNLVKGNKVFEKLKIMGGSASRIKELVATQNPVVDEAMKTQLARMMGEVGNISDADKEAFGGSKAIVDRMKRYTSKQATGQLTEQDRSYISELAEVMLETSRDGVNKIRNEALPLAAAFGIDSATADQILDFQSQFEVEIPQPGTKTTFESTTTSGPAAAFKPKQVGRFTVEEVQ